MQSAAVAGPAGVSWQTTCAVAPAAAAHPAQPSVPEHRHARLCPAAASFPAVAVARPDPRRSPMIDRSVWRLVLGYGLLAALLLVCLQLLKLAPLRLAGTRELAAAVVAAGFFALGWLLRAPERRTAASPPPAQPSAPAAARPPPAPELSAREHQILAHLAAGLSNEEIAARLFVSINTVKTHLANLYTKLGVRRRTQAVAAARYRGLLGADDTPRHAATGGRSGANRPDG